MEKITEEGLHSCPVCKVDLGSAPLQELRVECPHVQGDTKISGEILKSESFEEGTISTEKCIPMEEGDQAEHQATLTLPSNQKKIEKDVAQGSPSKGNAPEMSDIETQTGKSTENAIHVCTKPQQDRAAIEQQSRTEDSSACAKGMQEGVSQVLGHTATAEVMADESNKHFESFWFALVASNEQKTEAPLDQIPTRYLRVRNGSITVSSIKKYLMRKLNLTSENEVEISMQGRQLLPTMQVRELLNLWVHTASPSYTATRRAFVGCSAEEFVMTLTYGRIPEV